MATLTCFGGAAAQRPKRNEYLDHDRPTLRCSEREQARAEWRRGSQEPEGPSSVTNDLRHRAQEGQEHSSEWRWAVQQTTRQRVSAGRTTVDDRGNRAVQSPTKGAECRPSRQRLSDEAFPATHKSGHTRGTAEFTTMPRSATTNQRNRCSGRNSLFTRRARRSETVELGSPRPREARK